MGRLTWLEYLMKEEGSIHRAKIVDFEGNEHIFQVNYQQYSQNEGVQYVVTFEDITDIEREMAKNRQKDQQLLEQSRFAQMGEMIAMIAHQWRQPLSAISAASAGIKLKAKMNKLDNDRAIVLADKIADYAQHLSHTIDDFREFFKSNKEKKETSYEDIVSCVLNIVEENIQSKNIILQKNLQCQERFESYPNEIKQVLLNLLKNAEDVLLEKGIPEAEISVRTYKENSDLVLEVRDNAGGIPSEVLGKIFDPYFSTKTQKDGTGLGLYMSKIIVEEHCGGTLEAFNSEKGAVFKIVLHVQRQEEETL